MPPPARASAAEVVYHVINRGKNRAWALSSSAVSQETLDSLLHPGPVERPKNWLARVNAAETPAELEQIRTSLQRGRPFGDATWARRTAAKLGLEPSLRPRGRPKAEET